MTRRDSRNGNAQISIENVSATGLLERMSVEWYSWHARGGPHEARLQARMTPAELGWLPALLGRGVTVYDGALHRVWWGYLAWFEVGGMRTSLLETYNRVAVRYAGGTTAWATDEESIRRYGARERLFTATTLALEAAEAMRDALLAVHAMPHPVPLKLSIPAEAQPARNLAVRLGCCGWWETLDWEMYAQPLREAANSGVFPNAWQTFGRSKGEYRVAGSFAIPAGERWTLRQIVCTLRTSGSPGDRVLVRIHQDAGGLPGARLAGGAIEADDLSNGGGSVAIPLNQPVTLETGTYWVVWNRSGALLFDDAYELAYQSGVKTYLLYSNGSWTTKSGTLALSLLGGEHLPSESLIPQVVGDAGQFLAGTSLVGIRAPETTLPNTPLLEAYEDGSRSGLAVLHEYLDYGTLDGRRLLAQVTPQRVVRVFAEPQASAQTLTLRADGALYDGERRLSPAALEEVVGRWVRVEQGGAVLPAGDAGLSGAVFIEQARYDTPQMRLTLSPRRPAAAYAGLAKRLSVWE